MKARVRFSILLLAISLLLSGSINLKPLTTQEILDLVNVDRVNHGLPILSLDQTLNSAASAKAEDMVAKNYFAHVAPDGTKPWDWFKDSGYNYAYAGENLAEGFSDPADLENSWMASPSHRANILSPFYSDVGLAVVAEGNSNIVVQFFGSKENRVSLRQ